MLHHYFRCNLSGFRARSSLVLSLPQKKWLTSRLKTARRPVPSRHSQSLIGVGELPSTCRALVSPQSVTAPTLGRNPKTPAKVGDAKDAQDGETRHHQRFRVPVHPQHILEVSSAPGCSSPLFNQDYPILRTEDHGAEGGVQPPPIGEAASALQPQGEVGRRQGSGREGDTHVLHLEAAAGPRAMHGVPQVRALLRGEEARGA